MVVIPLQCKKDYDKEVVEDYEPCRVWVDPPSCPYELWIILVQQDTPSLKYTLESDFQTR